MKYIASPLNVTLRGAILFAHKYLMKVAASVVFSVSSFISLIVMARYVGEAYGMMMWGMSLVAMFNTTLDIGFHSVNIKKISEGKDLNKCVSTYLAIRIVISAVMICLLLMSALLIGDGFPDEFWMVTMVFTLYYVLDNFVLVINGTFIGRLDAGKESLVLTSTYIVRSASLIMFAFLGASAVILSFGYVLGAVCSLAVGYTLFRSLKVKLVRPVFFREYASFVLPLALPSILMSVIAFVDKVLIGAYYGELDVAFYTAATGITFSLVTLGAVMNGLLLSHMTRLNTEGNKDESRNTLWAAQKYLAVIMLPATAFLLVFGSETAVALFGPGFADSGPVLAVLALNIFLAVLIGMFAQVLFSVGRTGLYGKVAVIYAVFTLTLFLILIPGELLGLPAGGVGAAISVVTGNILFVVLLTFVIKRSGSPGLYPRIYIHVLAAVVVGIMLYAVRTYLGPENIIWLIVLAIISVAVYSLILAVVREITKKDIVFIKESLDPRNIYEDLRDEFKGN